jgi:hypothetical protein
MNNQTLNFQNNITKLHKLTLDKGTELQVFERYRIGCKPTICELYDLVVLGGIVCRELCYIGKEEEDIINDYLIRK